MRKIVIIEDNAVVAHLYESKLRAAGNHVTVAYDGAEGLRKIYDTRPDLVLLDLMLPNKSGIEIIKEIRADYRYTNLPIMAYSAADESILMQAVEAGSTTIISKNRASFKEIFAHFNELMEASRYWQVYNPNNFPETWEPSEPAPELEEFDPWLLDVNNLPGTARREPDPRENEWPEGPFFEPGTVPEDEVSEPAPELVAVGPESIMLEAEPVVDVPTEKPAEFAPPPPKQNRLLIVEDDLLTSCIISGIAEAQGLEPVALGDGQDAYELLLKDPNFAAVILDIELPRVKGTEILKFIRGSEKLRHLPVIVMTALSDYIKLQIESYEAGATCFISKPFERPTVESLFKAMLNK